MNLRDLRLLAIGVLLFGGGLSLVLLLKLLELLETLVGGLLFRLVLLCSIMSGLFFVESGAVLEHLLNLLCLGILRLLLLRERLTGSTKLVGLSRAVAKVEPVHDARDLLFGDVAQGIDTSAYSTQSTLRVTEGVVKEASRCSCSRWLSRAGLECAWARDRAKARL